jgi:hypothetical protein
MRPCVSRFINLASNFLNQNFDIETPVPETAADGDRMEEPKEEWWWG